ncbi:MAG TPA: thioredoxin family protein [Bryobacteraceae bacterium]|nr:thioredoxin family protein [Bryobacteraceae bacterium]
MKLTMLSISLALALGQLSAQTTKPFAPLKDWEAAVARGDEAALSKLYSLDPAAVTQAGKNRISANEEWKFWTTLKSSGMTEFHPRLLEINQGKDKALLLLRISINSGGSQLVAGMRQDWARQKDGWKLIASVRSEAFGKEAPRTLPQPAAPNVALYSAPAEAETELKAGLARAAKEDKRVLVVFGANWCYDCHVLDTTFHSKEFAPLVDGNYVVIHINIGEEGKDNNDLAARLGVALDKGVPSLGVLEPNGKVVYAQKNGEFEATEKIGPEDIRGFLEKWKPHRG